MTELKGKKCLITGASRGVGEAIALVYAAEGAVLFLAARSGDALRILAEKCRARGSPQVEVFEVDLSKSSEVQGLGDKIISTHGGVDVLVNNAGFASKGSPLEGEPDEWEKAFAVNVHAPMRLTRILSPKMAEKESGVIINLCSVAALEGLRGAGAYAATKHALRGWNSSCYEALRALNIKVMAIHPGLINTEFVAGNSSLDYSRMIQPSDIAEVAMLPFRTSCACCPVEVTLRLTRPAVKV